MYVFVMGVTEDPLKVAKDFGENIGLGCCACYVFFVGWVGALKLCSVSVDCVFSGFRQVETEPFPDI